MEKETAKKKWSAKNIKEKKRVINRLSIMEGQVRGIKQMVLEDRHCEEVLMQISAVVNSLRSLESQILKEHLSSCIMEERKKESSEAVEEIMNLFKILK